ncbi:MAG: NADH-ubiquinone oxidoreductase [Deltaproteobacteria bacterium]|nr:NADH-ubiquinone oxidoreductase [Deltaproteobacteria bacterium]
MTANDALAVAAIVLPLAVGVAIGIRSLREAALAAAPWTALPAFVAALDGGASSVHADALLFGTTIGVEDVVTRVFLVLTATVWLASAAYARTYMAWDPRRARYWVFASITASGNIGLVLAQDVASFYLFYSVMTFGAYGLVAHVSTAEARRAGAVYLKMALLGEMLLLAAFVILVGARIDLPLHEAPRAVADSPHRDLVVGLLLAGFGVKAGAIVLHVWLPVAHPAAPTPASAALSGAMIAAGVLGWLRFLPLGIVALPGAGRICLAGGFAAAFYGVAVGVTQRDPKTVLAYSSVSQMGFVTAALGVALASPSTAPLATAAILFYVLHHALAKAALFLGTGIAMTAPTGWPRRLALAGLLVSALDLAGAPLSSGALAKISLKHLAADRGAAFGMLLSAGAIGSTLLMVRVLSLAAARRGPVARRPLPWVPWLLLLALDVALLAAPPIDRERLELLVDPASVASAAWPVLAGIAIAFAGRRLVRGLAIPPGDLLVVFERVGAWLRARIAGAVRAGVRAEDALRAWLARRVAVPRRRQTLLREASRLERGLSGFAPTGVALLVLGIVLAWASR